MPPKVPRGPQLPSGTLDWELLKKQKPNLSLDHISEIAELASTYLQPEAAEFSEEDMLSHLESLYKISQQKETKMSKKHAKQLEKIIISVSGMPHLHFPKPVQKILEYTNKRHNTRNKPETEGIQKTKDNEKTKEEQRKEKEKSDELERKKKWEAEFGGLKKRFRFLDTIVDPEHNEQKGLEKVDREAMHGSVDKALEVYQQYHSYHSSQEFSDAMLVRIAECKRATGDLIGAASEFMYAPKSSPAGKFFIEELTRIGMELAHIEIGKGNFALAHNIYVHYLADAESYNRYVADRALNGSPAHSGRESQALLMLALDMDKEINRQVESALDSKRRGDFASAAKSYVNASLLEPHYSYADNTLRSGSRVELLEKAVHCYEKAGDMENAASLSLDLLGVQEDERYSRASLLPGIIRTAELMEKAGRFEEGGQLILQKTRWWKDYHHSDTPENKDEMSRLMPNAIWLALRLLKKSGNFDGMGACYSQLVFWDSGKELKHCLNAARSYEKAGNVESARDQFNSAYHKLSYKDEKVKLKAWLAAKVAELEVAVSDLESTPEHLKKDNRIRAIRWYMGLAFDEKSGFKKDYFKKALSIAEKYGLWEDEAKIVEHYVIFGPKEFEGQSHVKTYIGLKVKAAEEEIKKGNLAAGADLYASFSWSQIPEHLKGKYARLAMGYYFKAAANEEKAAIKAEKEGREFDARTGYEKAAGILWNKVAYNLLDNQSKLRIYLKAGELYLRVGGLENNKRAASCYMGASGASPEKSEEYARKACDLLLAADDTSSLFSYLANYSTSERGSGKKNGMYGRLYYEYLIKYGKKLEAENNLDMAGAQFNHASLVLKSKEKSAAARLLAYNAFVKSSENKEKEGDFSGASNSIEKAMENAENEAKAAMTKKAIPLYLRAAQSAKEIGRFGEAQRLYLMLADLVKKQDYERHLIYSINGASADLIGTDKFKEYIEKNGGRGKRVIGAFSRLLHYGSPAVLNSEDIKAALDHPQAYSQLSGFFPMGFLPMKSVIEAFIDPARKDDMVARIRRTKPFNPQDEFDIQVEYCKAVPALSAIAKTSGEFALTFSEFKDMVEGKFGRLNADSQVMAEKNELLYAGYEVLLSDGVLSNIAADGHRKVNVLGNMRLGAVYSEALEEMHENDKTFYFSVSRFGSTELHNMDYALKRELIPDKKVLAGFFHSEPLIVMDASQNNRMPDAFKAYRSYAAALEMMRIGESNSFAAENFQRISEQTNIPAETLVKIRTELFADGGKFRDAMKGWFLKPERIKPFRVFEVDMNGSGVYRVSREIQGEKRRQGVSSGTPSAEDLANFNCMVLVQASLGDDKVPVAVKEKLGVTSQHKLAYFDDQDHLLSAMFSIDAHGVDIQPSVVPQLAQAAINAKEKLSM